MAGTSKGYSTTEIVQGPGDLWVIGTAPDDTAERLTLASDGTPDATAHPASVHLGAIQSAITTAVKPKIEPMTLDQYDAPFDSYVTDLNATIEAELAQTESQKLQRMLGVGVYGSGAGYKQVTFGGLLTVPKVCIAVISKAKDDADQHIVSLLYSAVATGGFNVTMGRAKANTFKAQFTGLSDYARTAGKQVGVIYRTLADAAGGTPTAKDFSVAEIFQGPADLWAIDAPTDGDTRVTLDAATLTPDAAKHPNAVHLGGTTGAVEFTVTPKLEYNRMDQFDAAVDVFIAQIEAKISAEMAQTGIDKLSRALGVSTYSTTPGSFAQMTFGGTNQPPTISVCAIGRKRSAPTKAVVACLYKVNSVEGAQLVASRQKASAYKVTFSGLLDPTRTAGKQMGVFHEMV